MEDKGEARQDHSQHEHEAEVIQSASEDSAHTGQTARWVDMDVDSFYLHYLQYLGGVGV